MMNYSKATEEEGFQAKFVKHNLHALVSYSIDLFNDVVRTNFPSAWLHHMIHPVTLLPLYSVLTIPLVEGDFKNSSVSFLYVVGHGSTP